LFGIFRIKRLIEEPPPQKKVKTSHIKSTAKSRIWEAETREPIATNFACRRVPSMT